MNPSTLLPKDGASIPNPEQSRDLNRNSERDSSDGSKKNQKNTFSDIKMNIRNSLSQFTSENISDDQKKKLRNFGKALVSLLESCESLDKDSDEDSSASKNVESSLPSKKEPLNSEQHISSSSWNISDSDSSEFSPSESDSDSEFDENSDSSSNSS
jgi:hypothetical protein